MRNNTDSSSSNFCRLDAIAAPCQPLKLLDLFTASLNEAVFKNEVVLLLHIYLFILLLYFWLDDGTDSGLAPWGESTRVEFDLEEEESAALSSAGLLRSGSGVVSARRSLSFGFLCAAESVAAAGTEGEGVCVKQ